MKSTQILVGLLLVTGAGVAGAGLRGVPEQAASSTEGRAARDEVLPKDVNPDTGSRLPAIKRDALDERGKRVYDAAGPGGPQGAAALRLHKSGVDVRWDSPLGRQLTELAIITTAREHDQQYEWSLHEMEAVAVGLDPAVIDIVRNRKPLSGVDAKQAAIIQIGRETFGKHKLSAETFARARQLFGETNLVDVVDLMAGYAGTATNLTAANQYLPPQMKNFLPVPFTPANDIHPDSRSRIPVATPQTPAPAQGRGANQAPVGLYRRNLAPPPTGPGSMGRPAAGLKSLEASVGRPLMGLAILITAREHDEQYDWTMNELAARKDGLDSTIIDVVRNRKPVTGLGEKEAMLIELGRELFGKHNVTAETYARALKVFGQRDLSDFVVGLMAPHASDAGMLTAFDQHLPAGQKPLLPMP